MDHSAASNDDADRINEQMVRQMELRRQQRPDRRQRRTGGPDKERRTICAYCFQPGDHQSPAQCLRALER